MDDVTKFLLAQGVMGAFIILETALIWYLLGEVKRLSTRLESIQGMATKFDAFLSEVRPGEVSQRQADKLRRDEHDTVKFSRDK